MKFNNHNVKISPSALIGKNVKIGDGSVIYDNVVIEDNVVIANDCVIGEPLNDFYTNEQYVNPKTVIGKNSLIRSHCILYAGSTFGNNFSTGHRVTIREEAHFGTNCRVGTLSDFQGYSNIGNNCWFHSNVFVCQRAEISNYVMVYPHVVMTDDPTPPSNIGNGPIIHEYAQIGARSLLLPGVEIGEHALVGASSVVTTNIDAYQLVLGNPARPIKDTREIISRQTGKSHYPWPYNFERGMPWEGMGYDKWLKDND